MKRTTRVDVDPETLALIQTDVCEVADWILLRLRNQEFLPLEDQIVKLAAERLLDWAR